MINVGSVSPIVWVVIRRAEQPGVDGVDDASETSVGNPLAVVAGHIALLVARDGVYGDLVGGFHRQSSRRRDGACRTPLLSSSTVSPTRSVLRLAGHQISFWSSHSLLAAWPWRSSATLPKSCSLPRTFFAQRPVSWRTNPNSGWGLEGLLAALRCWPDEVDFLAAISSWCNAFRGETRGVTAASASVRERGTRPVRGDFLGSLASGSAILAQLVAGKRLARVAELADALDSKSSVH